VDSVERWEQDYTGEARTEAVVMTSAAHDPYAALRYRDFRLFIIGRFVATLGEQMITVALGWELYERTNSELALGLVGLVEVLPVMSLIASRESTSLREWRVCSCCVCLASPRYPTRMAP